jgi:tryptophan-rich sensory protein
MDSDALDSDDRPAGAAPARGGRPVEAHILALLVIAGAAILASVLGGSVSGGETDPWYQALDKSPLNPPGFVFGVVWSTLYTLMALGAYLVWRRAGWRGGARALALYFAQLVANLGWSVLFFGLRQPVAALADLVLLWVLIALMIAAFWHHSRVAAQLQLPYLAWVTFAGYLNGYIVVAN